MEQKGSQATFTLRMPRDLGGQIQGRADAARMSKNAWVLKAIDRALVDGIDHGKGSNADSGMIDRAMWEECQREAWDRLAGRFSIPASGSDLDAITIADDEKLLLIKAINDVRYAVRVALNVISPVFAQSHEGATAEDFLNGAVSRLNHLASKEASQ